jgi:hypothetical protein
MLHMMFFYCDGMKGDTLTLLYRHLFELDTYYSKPIKGLNETIRTKLHNVFMNRWSVFHVPVQSALILQWTDNCVGGTWISVSRRISRLVSNGGCFQGSGGQGFE